MLSFKTNYIIECVFYHCKLFIVLIFIFYICIVFSIVKWNLIFVFIENKNLMKQRFKKKNEIECNVRDAVSKRAIITLQLS